MKRDIGLFIEDIIKSIKNIEEFSRSLDKDKFSKDNLRQSAIIRQLEIIGEAVKNISENLKNKNREIEWRNIASTRDKMIHHYFGVDLNIIWEIIKKDLPVLEKQIKKIKKELILTK